jgi:hypothetical protein
MFEAVAARLNQMFRRRKRLPAGADLAADDWHVPESLPTAITLRPPGEPASSAFDRRELRSQLEQVIAAEECEWEELVADSIGPPIPKPATPPRLPLEIVPVVKAAPTAVAAPPADSTEDREWRALLERAKQQPAPPPPAAALAAVPAAAAPPPEDDESNWSALLAQAKARAPAAQSDEEREWRALLARAKSSTAVAARRPRRAPAIDDDREWKRLAEQAKRRAIGTENRPAPDDEWAAALRRAKRTALLSAWPRSILAS